MKTKALKAYAEFKTKYPGYVLFFRADDFYNVYEADARIVSKVCGTTLVIRRNKDTCDEVAMTGVPADGVENTLRAMIAVGHKCAICEVAK